MAIYGLGLLGWALIVLYQSRSDKSTNLLDHLVSERSFGPYFSLWIILLTNPFNVFKWSSSIYIFISLVLVAISCYAIIRDIYTSRKLFTTAVIGHVFFCYCLLHWSKNAYINEWGNTQIGSYWEKESYTAKYLVKISKSETAKEYSLPAIIYVSSEWGESPYPSEDMMGIEYFETFENRRIYLERVFFSGAGYLEFDDCILEVGKKSFCIDREGGRWNIELTNEQLVK
jgi:hypothetical protein